MGIKLIKKEGKYVSNISEFEVDKVDDIKLLPTNKRNGLDQYSHLEKCPVFSEVFVMETSDVYKLGSDDVWRVLGG